MLHTIKATLTERRITQYELAQEMGISETRMSRLMRGRAQPTDDEKREIARLLRRRVDELFDEVARPGESRTSMGTAARKGAA